MAEQLAMAVPEPGYYSCWAETKNRMSGAGGVSWHPDEASARAHAAASFDRGYRSWPEERRPRAEVVRVELLVPGPNRGRWADLTQEQRDDYTKDHPWFTSDRRPRKAESPRHYSDMSA